MHAPVQGIVFRGRTEGGLSPEKEEFQRSSAEGQRLQGLSFAQAVERVQPTALVGAAAKRSSFSQEVIHALQEVSGSYAKSCSAHCFFSCFPNLLDRR